MWIKFRQAATPGSSRKRKSCATLEGEQFGDESKLRGVYVRHIKDRSGSIKYKYEPRFKPPREAMDCGIINCLSLGQYDTCDEAKIVRQIAAFYYGKGEGRVAFEDGSYFSLPLMSERQKCLNGMDKAKWVTSKAKTVFKDIQEVKSKQLRRASETGAHSGHGSDVRSDPSPSTLAFTCSSPASNSIVGEPASSSLALVQLAPSHEDNGEEHAVTSVNDSLHVIEPIPAIVEQFHSNLFRGNQYEEVDLQWEENIVQGPADSLGKAAEQGDDYSNTYTDFKDIIDALLNPEGLSTPPYQSSFLDNQMRDLRVETLDNPTPPQLEVVNQAFGFIASQPSRNLDFQQGWGFVGAVPENIVTIPVLQQLVNLQKKLLEDSAVRNVDLQHQLCEFEAKNSELQREKSELEQENKLLRTILQQVPGSHVATWSGI